MFYIISFKDGSWKHHLNQSQYVLVISKVITLFVWNETPPIGLYLNGGGSCEVEDNPTLGRAFPFDFPDPGRASDGFVMNGLASESALELKMT